MLPFLERSPNVPPAIFNPPRPEELPEEFKTAVKLNQFHRYAIALNENGVRVFFGLVSEDGTQNYYSVDLGTMRSISTAFASLTQQGENISNGLGLKPETVPFETGSVFVGVMHGGGGGHLMLSLATTSHTLLTTILRPEIGAMLIRNLQASLATLPQPPNIGQHPLSGGDVPGKHHKGNTATYFGQEYRADILQAFGVLMVRANLLERSLIKLLSAISGLSADRSEAAYYSTSNFKARCDLVRSLVKFSPVKESTKNMILSSIDNASSVAMRRNDLVHANWSFYKDKFEIEIYRPNSNKGNRQKNIITSKAILDIAETYRSVGVMIEAQAGVVTTEATSIATNIAATPSSTSRPTDSPLPHK